MKILITGIGITGKSSFRRILVGKLREMGVGVAQYDADEFKELRHQADAGCEKPEEFWKGVVYVIEDIHGPEEDKSCLPLRDYDLILYLLPSKTSHAVFWFSRMWRWFQSGQFSWQSHVQVLDIADHCLLKFVFGLSFRRAPHGAPGQRRAPRAVEPRAAS